MHALAVLLVAFVTVAHCQQQQGSQLLALMSNPALLPGLSSSLQPQQYYFVRRREGAIVNATSDDYAYLKTTLLATLKPADFLYAFTGDPQLWFYCTSENTECQSFTKCSLSGPSRDACIKKQGEFSNVRVRQAIVALWKLIGTIGTSNRMVGLIINGDLTNYGHDDELKRYLQLWGPTAQDMPSLNVYSGLGNHDYANNVNDCTLNHCANRMLNWLTDHLARKPPTTNFRFDAVQRKESALSRKTVTGSLGYSWDECTSTNNQTSSTRCIRFFQLNNYPSYKVSIDALFAEWSITAGLDWLSRELRKLPPNNISIVLNFHDFDTHFSDAAKQDLIALLSRYPQVEVLAILFAHLHSSVGVRGYWCIHSRPVPLIYTGSIPGNNFLLIRFGGVSTGKLSIQQIFRFHASTETTSYVTDVPINPYC